MHFISRPYTYIHIFVYGCILVYNKNVSCSITVYVLLCCYISLNKQNMVYGFWVDFLISLYRLPSQFKKHSMVLSQGVQLLGHGVSAQVDRTEQYTVARINKTFFLTVPEAGSLNRGASMVASRWEPSSCLTCSCLLTVSSCVRLISPSLLGRVLIPLWGLPYHLI